PWSLLRFLVLRRPGGSSEEPQPDPIPNSAVKLLSANGTMAQALGEEVAAGPAKDKKFLFMLSPLTKPPPLMRRRFCLCERMDSSLPTPISDARRRDWRRPCVRGLRPSAWNRRPYRVH